MMKYSKSLNGILNLNWLIQSTGIIVSITIKQEKIIKHCNEIAVISGKLIVPKLSICRKYRMLYYYELCVGSSVFCSTKT